MTRSGFKMQRVLILLAALAGVLVTASLGQWQLGRAAQKQALVDAQSAKAALPPLDGSALGQAGDSAENREGLLHRAVRLRGHWLSKGTVYLDNRQMQGRAGFYVVTPLILENSNTVILVQRGWVPRSFTDRAALPAISTPEGVVELEGHLSSWPSRMYALGGDEAGPIRQNLDFEVYRRQTTPSLLEVSVVQSGPASEGLLRDWPVVASGIEKHLGYAFQWFGLSALIVLLYVWFQIVRPFRKNTAA